ncbi:MAG: hypothetical protein ACNA8W_24265, partial [Bradymonadaceae bacterium]
MEKVEGGEEISDIDVMLWIRDTGILRPHRGMGWREGEVTMRNDVFLLGFGCVGTGSALSRGYT